MRVSLIRIRAVSRRLAITRWVAGLIVLALVSTFTPCCEVYAAGSVADASSDHGHDGTASHEAGALDGLCGHWLDNYHVSAGLPQAALIPQKVDIGMPWLLAAGALPPLESILTPLTLSYYPIPPPGALYLLHKRLIL